MYGFGQQEKGDFQISFICRVLESTFSFNKNRILNKTKWIYVYIKYQLKRQYKEDRDGSTWKYGWLGVEMNEIKKK